jgi:hypothetical protein
MEPPLNCWEIRPLTTVKNGSLRSSGTDHATVPLQYYLYCKTWPRSFQSAQQLLLRLGDGRRLQARGQCSTAPPGNSNSKYPGSGDDTPPRASRTARTPSVSAFACLPAPSLAAPFQLATPRIKRRLTQSVLPAILANREPTPPLLPNCLPPTSLLLHIPRRTLALHGFLLRDS